jgi:prophage regulatory protein
MSHHLVLTPGGFIRLPRIIGDRRADPPIPALIPVSASTWWRWIAEGRAPAGVKIGPNVTAWKTEDIAALVQKLGSPV